MLIRTTASLGLLLTSRPTTLALKTGMGLPDRNKSLFSGKTNSRALYRWPVVSIVQNFWARSIKLSGSRGNRRSCPEVSTAVATNRANTRQEFLFITSRKDELYQRIDKKIGGLRAPQF